MIKGKTAVMFEACARCGAILSGASSEEVELLGKWGLNLGLCFQIVDDLIDVISESSTSGKPIGSDLVQGKMTCMVIHAMNSSGFDLSGVEAILGKGSKVTKEQIETAISNLENTGSIEYCRALANKYYSISKECLIPFKDSNGYEVLSDLTDYHINRIN